MNETRNFQGRGHGGGRGRHGEGAGPFGGRGHGPHGGSGEGRGEGRGDGRGEGRGGRRHGKRFAGEELRLLVLAQLADGPMHGYQVIRALAEKSGEAYSPSPGVLYPLLTMLQDMELVAEQGSEGSSRRSFALTEAGRAELEAGQATLQQAETRLAAMAQSAARTDGGPVKRAMMNLRTATMQRLNREGAADTLVFDIAAILDEAAQKIERL